MFEESAGEEEICTQFMRGEGKKQKHIVKKCNQVEDIVAPTVRKVETE
jgi:hypothetical protein